MRREPAAAVEGGHVEAPEGPGPFGRFVSHCPVNGNALNCVVSDGRGWGELGLPGLPGGPWEHVSVSVEFHRRCPTWAEMCRVKDQFWEPGEWVLQYHPAREDYVNFNPRVLHLWMPVGVDIPTPPKECV